MVTNDQTAMETKVAVHACHSGLVWQSSEQPLDSVSQSCHSLPDLLGLEIRDQGAQLLLGHFLRV
jgi:hypothetical protein